MNKTPKYIKEALSIGELKLSLENISSDDGVEIESYSKEEIVNEARYTLSIFFEPGTLNNLWLTGEDGDTTEAEHQVKSLQKFIKKYA